MIKKILGMKSSQSKTIKTFFIEHISRVFFCVSATILAFYFCDLALSNSMRELQPFKDWRENEVWFILLLSYIGLNKVWIPILFILTFSSFISLIITKQSWAKNVFNISIRLFTSLSLAHLIVHFIKGLVGRGRPYTVDLGYVPNTFKPLMFLQNYSSDFSSFPSGHAATSFALATSFFIIFPKSKANYIIFTLAILVCLQRIICLKHYLSDIIFGMYLGISCSYLIDYVILRLYNTNFIKNRIS